MFDEQIHLVKFIDGAADEFGDPVQEEQKRAVFAQVASIGTVEFYQAQTAGKKPEIKFILADCLDYDGEQDVIYRGYRYKVLRTYQKNTELEITCYGGVRDATA